MRSLVDSESFMNVPSAFFSRSRKKAGLFVLFIFISAFTVPGDGCFLPGIGGKNLNQQMMRGPELVGFLRKQQYPRRSMYGIFACICFFLGGKCIGKYTYTECLGIC